MLVELKMSENFKNKSEGFFGVSENCFKWCWKIRLIGQNNGSSWVTCNPQLFKSFESKYWIYLWMKQTRIFLEKYKVRFDRRRRKNSIEAFHSSNLKSQITTDICYTPKSRIFTWKSSGWANGVSKTVEVWLIKIRKRVR